MLNLTKEQAEDILSFIEKLKNDEQPEERKSAIKTTYYTCERPSGIR